MLTNQILPVRKKTCRNFFAYSCSFDASTSLVVFFVQQQFAIEWSLQIKCFLLQTFPKDNCAFVTLYQRAKCDLYSWLRNKISSVRFPQVGTLYYIFTRGHWIFIAFFDHWISQRRNFECKQERTKWLSNLVKFLAKNRTNFLFFQIGANYACFASSWTAKHLFFPWKSVVLHFCEGPD